MFYSIIFKTMVFLFLTADISTAVLLSLHWGFKVILNSLGHVTSLLLGSPVVDLPPFSLWTGMFCNISFANDRTVITLWFGHQTLVSYSTLHHRQVRGLGRRGYWIHFTIEIGLTHNDDDDDDDLYSPCSCKAYVNELWKKSLTMR